MSFTTTIKKLVKETIGILSQVLAWLQKHTAHVNYIPTDVLHSHDVLCFLFIHSLVKLTVHSSL